MISPAHFLCRYFTTTRLSNLLLNYLQILLEQQFMYRSKPAIIHHFSNAKDFFNTGKQNCLYFLFFGNFSRIQKFLTRHINIFKLKKVWVLLPQFTTNQSIWWQQASGNIRWINISWHIHPTLPGYIFLNNLKSIFDPNLSIFFLGEGRGPSFIPIYHFHPLRNTQTFIWKFIWNLNIQTFISNLSKTAWSTRTKFANLTNQIRFEHLATLKLFFLLTQLT